MYIFRLAFLEENVLAHIQETGYSHLSNQSKIAIKYLDWIAHSENKQILHRDNSATGEVVMDTFYKINVDGMDVANYEIYEINGCRFHM
uniref:Uncharacterized protein n=1 Tax=Panagrolaimus superbus TaxID=310955 RepID=A0A914YEM8_9BILA